MVRAERPRIMKAKVLVVADNRCVRLVTATCQDENERDLTKDSRPDEGKG